MKFLKKLFGDQNDRELKKLWPVVDEINEYREEYESLSEDEAKQLGDLLDKLRG